MRREKGFTLIELMVVIVIIAILAAVALPNFMGATEKARESAVRSAVKTIQTAIEMYATEHSGTYTDDLNAYTAYLPGNQFPKSPATNQPYKVGENLFDSDSPIKDNPTTAQQYAITYQYDPVTNSYTLKGYNRTNTTAVIELSNR
ncbi:MAG: prepilin-type cleavage/methylation domain-containing protein [Dictyoglomus sp. NZ13-RE01]|nr:MAG: prepilin-type cleavage/methylation domain-containing protein [Dictyoglomus sp. NZ13-RE01]